MTGLTAHPERSEGSSANTGSVAGRFLAALGMTVAGP